MEKKTFFMIYDSLPIFFDNDVPREGSWIYLALILTLLKVRRAVIPLLITILLEIWCRVWLRNEEHRSF